MTDHPITPSPELIRKWNEEAATAPMADQRYIAIQAAHWGADQELEACCEWLHWQNLATHPELIPSLRAARRSKPPSLKEQALTALTRYTTGETILTNESVDTIRRALEQIDD